MRQRQGVCSVCKAVVDLMPSGIIGPHIDTRNLPPLRWDDDQSPQMEALTMCEGTYKKPW